jgi:hypothetical protein
MGDEGEGGALNGMRKSVWEGKDVLIGKSECAGKWDFHIVFQF